MEYIRRSLPNLVGSLCNQGPEGRKYVISFKTTPGYVPTCFSCCVPVGSMKHYIFVLDEHIDAAVTGAFREVFPGLNFDEVQKSEGEMSRTDAALLRALKGRYR